jgi:hypothetical protein
MTPFDSFVPIDNNLGTIVDVSKSRDFINDDVQKEVMV